MAIRYDSNFQTRARTFARKTGLLYPLRIANRIFFKSGKSYEQTFENAILCAIQPGHRVWDVGANVGFYTKKFANKVTATGTVVAFEPAPACFRVLSELFPDLPNVILENVAVGSLSGEVQLQVDADPLAATHQVRARDRNFSLDSDLVSVPMICFDDYFQSTGHVPNVLKIDVEGFEEEVLLGMEKLIRQPELKAIFVEVHFGLLEKMGRPLAPNNINKILTAAGFDTSWLDSSHLQAIRQT